MHLLMRILLYLFSVKSTSFVSWMMPKLCLSVQVQDSIRLNVYGELAKILTKALDHILYDIKW